MQHFLPSLTTLEVLPALFAVMVLGAVQPSEPYYEQSSAIQLHLASTMGSDFFKLNQHAEGVPAGHSKTRIAFCWTKKEKKDRYSMKYIWPSVWKPKNESSCLQEHLRKRHSKDLNVWIFCLPMWPDTNLNTWQIIWVQVKHSKLIQEASCFQLGAKQHQIHWELECSSILRPYTERRTVLQTSQDFSLLYFFHFRNQALLWVEAKDSDLLMALFRT